MTGMLKTVPWLAWLVVAVLVIGGIGLAWVYFDRDDRVCTVTSKDRVSTNGESKKRIYVTPGPGCTTMRLDDSLYDFSTADTYGRIIEGHTYKFTTYGWRFGPTSSFPNIIEVEEVPSP